MSKFREMNVDQSGFITRHEFLQVVGNEGERYAHSIIIQFLFSFTFITHDGYFIQLFDFVHFETFFFVIYRGNPFPNL